MATTSTLPKHFCIGLINAVTELGWMTNSGIPWDYRYQYINPGWQSWASPNAQFVTNYVLDSQAGGYGSVFTYYVLGGTFFNTLADKWAYMRAPSSMAAYYADFTLMMQKIAAANSSSSIIVHVEPDLGALIQQAFGDDPTWFGPMSVASSGNTDVAGYTNDLPGFAQALLAIRNKYAPNVMMAWHPSYWAANNGYDPTLASPAGYQTPQTTATRVASFYSGLNAQYDLIFHDPSDSDSAYQVSVRGTPSGTAWWTDAAFVSYSQFIGTFYQATRLRSLLWQVPVGNTIYRTENNTNYHYQDNRVQYFLQSGNGQHILDYIGVGVVGLLIGQGQEACTHYTDHANDGITNPTAINGNSLTSAYSDDDGGNLRLSAQAYFASGGVSVGGTIRIKRRNSGSAGAPSTLANAEIAYNEVDDTLYYGKGGTSLASNSIVPIAGAGGFLTLSTTQTINGAKTFSTGPTVPTATTGTNTGQAASCAFVLANGGSYTLPTATATVLGGVKIGTGVTITNGVISVGSGAAEGGTSTKVAVIPSASYPASNTVDIGAKFNAAVAAVGAGGIVKIYPVAGGYACTTPMACTNGASVQGEGTVLINARLTSSQDAFTFGVSTDDTTGPVYAKNLKFECGNQGRDGVRVNQGIQLYMENIMIQNAGRDGFHVEVAFDGDYIECTQYNNIKTYHCARDGFHIEAGSSGFSTDYVNQTTFYNCNSRWTPNGHALKFVVNTGSDGSKISALEWINGELDAAGSSLADGVSMTVTNGGIIENIHFQGVAIEDAQTGAHAGHAINTGGTHSVTTTNCILAGFSGGNDIL